MAQGGKAACAAGLTFDFLERWVGAGGGHMGYRGPTPGLEAECGEPVGGRGSGQSSDMLGTVFHPQTPPVSSQCVRVVLGKGPQLISVHPTLSLMGSVLTAPWGTDVAWPVPAVSVCLTVAQGGTGHSATWLSCRSWRGRPGALREQPRVWAPAHQAEHTPPLSMVAFHPLSSLWNGDDHMELFLERRHMKAPHVLCWDIAALCQPWL